MSDYAFIHILDPARAAQYAALVQQQRLSVTQIRTAEEALFHAQRLGQAALIVTEIGGEGFDLLRKLRKARPAQTGPAIVISGSWEVRNEALRLKKPLGIVEVLASSQPVTTVERTLRRALSGATRGAESPQGGESPAAARAEATSAQRAAPEAPSFPPPEAPAPLAAAPGVAALAPGAPSFPPPEAPPKPDPAPSRERRKPAQAEDAALLAPAESSAPEPLEVLLARAARSLRASMALVWLGDDHGRGLQGHFGWDTDIATMVGSEDEWAPFRHLASEAPILVADAANDGLLSRSPLVHAGTVGSFAGAPLVDGDGRSAGALWVAHHAAGALDPAVLEPLTVWAQRIGADLARLARPAPKPAAVDAPAPSERFKTSKVPPAIALQQLAAHLEVGLLVTDDEGRIAFANQAVSRLFGLRTRRLTGLLRDRVLESLQLQADADVATLSRLSRTGQELRMDLTLRKPTHRVLRWETRPMPLDTRMGQLDQVTDVTVDVRMESALARLVRVDALTWLGNRKSMDEALGREISRALREKAQLALVLFQVDGHEALELEVQEAALREVAWLIADAMRGYDHAARIDPSTLSVLLPGAPIEAARKFAERIAREASELRHNKLPRITLSGGVAQFDRSEDVGQLVSRARAALLEAAACGGNGVL